MDLLPLVETADHPWFNQTLVQVGDVLVRLGVFRPGAFHWHRHDDQDEFFLVLDGRLRLDVEDLDPVELGPQQALSVAAGRLHRPVALQPTTVIMIERADVDPRGDRPDGAPTSGER